MSLPGILGRAALLLGLVASLNVVINPFDIYPSRLFEPIVISTRHTKLVSYRARRPPPEVVLIGSSRSMTIDPAYIEQRTARTAFNAAVHAATTRDYLAFGRCLAGAPVFPRIVVVGLGVEQVRGRGRLVEHEDALAECLPNGRRSALARFESLEGAFTLEQTWASLRVVAMEFRGRPDPLYRFRDDGMIVTRSVASLEEGLDSSLEGNWSPSLFAFEALDPATLGDIEGLLALCRDRGARVVVYLPPFHPRALARYLAESRFAARRQELRDQLARWAAGYPMTWYDFSEVASYGGTAAMFTDASHPSDEGSRHLVDSLLPALAAQAP